MARKYPVHLRTLLPRWARPRTAQPNSLAPPTKFRRGGTNFKWLRAAARSPVASKDDYADAANATDEGRSTQERQRNSSHRLSRNLSALPTLVQAKNLIRTVQNRNWQNLQRRPWLVVLLASGAAGIGALIWLFSVPPSPNCQQVSPLAADSERLYCADQAVRQGKLDQLVAALAVVRDWPQDHPLAPQANQLTDKWSRSILAIAQQRMDQGDLKEAVSIARQIPQTSSIYPEAQTTITAWQSNWDQGHKIVSDAQAALKYQEWRQALGQLQLLASLNNEYWQQQAGKLAQQIRTERQAWEQLYQAQDLAEANTSEQLAEAITLATQVNPKSYARDEAEAERERWSQALLEIAKEFLDAEDFEGVVTAAEKIPLDSSVYTEAQNLTQFGRAQVFAGQDTLWGYVGAWTLSQQIRPDHALYEETQTNITGWEGQVQSLAQLKLAGWFAGLDGIFAYQLAVDHAQMIGLDQPRRLQAQTLIAQWRKQIQILEDRPHILWAIHLAGQSTIQNLKLAITEVQKIDLGRVLRIEAQTLVAHWINRIQVIEDQPILDQARALADQGQLGEAIEVAERISADRALYGEAQAAIARWIGQIQIAEDQPILDEANMLAEQGDLTQAIAIASEISPGRALYPEAQGAISRWTAERDAILAPQQLDIAPEDSDLGEEEASSTEEDTVDLEEGTSEDTSSESDASDGNSGEDESSTEPTQ